MAMQKGLDGGNGESGVDILYMYEILKTFFKLAQWIKAIAFYLIT